MTPTASFVVARSFIVSRVAGMHLDAAGYLKGVRGTQTGLPRVGYPVEMRLCTSLDHTQSTHTLN
jgi:hypothetical protein